jgi:hypothetical protein
MRGFARRRAAGSLTVTLVTLLTIAWGCDDGKPPVSTSTTEAKVKGKVTINGKAPTKGQVTFNPSNYLRKTEMPRSGPIGKDGGYEVTTLVGENTVTLEGTGQDKALGYLLMRYDVQEGENTYDIDVGKKAR